MMIVMTTVQMAKILNNEQKKPFQSEPTEVIATNIIAPATSIQPSTRKIGKRKKCW